MYISYPWDTHHTQNVVNIKEITMTKLIAIILLTLPLSGFAQVCNHTIPSPATVPGGGVYHVSSDSIINDQDGSIYYLCSGVHLTVEGSAGCTYYLEDSCQITIKAHNGDVVNAKGYCTIIDSTSQSIIVNKEVTSTFSKPFMPSLGIVFTCSPMVYEYSLVGGSTPCANSTSIGDYDLALVSLYPNPTTQYFSIDLGENHQSIKINITDISGRLVQSMNYANLDLLNFRLDEPAGVYLLMVESGDRKTVIRLIKE
jgi:hypothetical protein